MKANEIIEIYTAAIREAGSHGIDTVPLAELKRVNAQIMQIAASSPADVAVGEAALEKYKAELSESAQHHRSLHEYSLEMLRATIMTAQAALKSALLINGGAAVAVLAFLGNAWSRNIPRQVMLDASYGLSLFVWGVLAAATAIGATYVSQAGFGGEFGNRCSGLIGTWGRWLAIGLVVVSYALFASAAWQTYLSLSS